MFLGTQKRRERRRYRKRLNVVDDIKKIGGYKQSGNEFWGETSYRNGRLFSYVSKPPNNVYIKFYYRPIFLILNTPPFFE